MSTAVEASTLGKTYRPFLRAPQRALDALVLAIPRGCAFGLIGPNGAGKTTFIKLLLGVARPTHGTISVLGGSPEDPAVRRRIGYLPERLQLSDAWTPVQFLASVARLKGVPSQPGLLDRVGLSDAKERKIGEFSKGMRQRVGLAAALIGSPELLVLDEPTDGIDPPGRVEVRRILLEEKARGATIVLNSHLLSETERVCDRVGILNRGRLVREGTLSALAASREGYWVTFHTEQDVVSFGFVRDGERWVFPSADVSLLNDALAAARGAGLLIKEVRPVTLELEQILTESLQ